MTAFSWIATRPIGSIVCKPQRSVALRFSREWLSNWVPSPESVGRPIPSLAQHGLGQHACGSAGQPRYAASNIGSGAAPKSVVAEQIAALLALAAGLDVAGVARRGQAARPHSSHDSGPPPRGGPDARAPSRMLTGFPSAISHYLFAHTNSTFGDELMSMRLECARRL